MEQLFLPILKSERDCMQQPLSKEQSAGIIL